MEKWEIRSPLPQKPLNRSSPKFAQMITSWTYTPFKILSRYDYPLPQICENAHQVTRLVFLVLPSAYSQDPCTDFHDQWRRFAQRCAFWGSREPHSPPKKQMFGQFLTGRRKFRVKQALTTGMLTCKLPTGIASLLTSTTRVIPCEYCHCHIPLKTRFFLLHFTCRKYRCIINHFYVMGLENYRVRRNDAK